MHERRTHAFFAVTLATVDADRSWRTVDDEVLYERELKQASTNRLPVSVGLAEVFIEMEYTSMKTSNPEALSLYYRTSILPDDTGALPMNTTRPIAIVYLRIAYCVFGILQMIVTCITLTVTMRIMQTLT
ncbi:unnamed protein product [Soboliphyme baturini]|uniref:Uncharacterized protein n=1 Tax=Soboliphyme baturini TaxID=241478 RepID=A0A183J1I1_9BILA|nr:unnamed protein product [Soboliphyme baturini]